MSDVITREITGAKAGQQQPSRPSIADDTIASISRLKMIIGLSEGEIKGLANGAKSIMLEGTPLEDENGNRNFEGVEWEVRHGTVDQTYIAGMPNASSEIGVGVTVRSGTPWIRSINDTQLSSINVNISFPMLKKVTDKGDVVGVTVDYIIEVQTDGGGYVPVVTKSLTAKTSGRYQRTHNVTLPEAQSNWQIRVRKITTDGDNETLFNTMQIDSIAEIIDGKFNYPHTAHLYLSLDARTFSNIPKVSVDMLGVYVQVPTNYDAETRTSTGIWQGQFKLGYTTNPAWHYYNLITNDRYGLGDKLQPFMIDKWALEHIARICDEPVDDGKGGTEPRFECNLYLQKSEDAYQVLQHIAGIFRGMSFWNGSKIFVDADTPRDCEYVITRANVIGGHFSKSGSAASDRHTIAQVAYLNPENAYETEYAMVRNERAIAQQGINVLDLAAVGCTSEGQAYRMGLAALLAEQNRTQTVSFAMGLDGSLPTVGSRIDIPDMIFTGANNSGRISSVSTNRTVITVDRDNIPATAGDKLIVNLESGKAQTRVITAVNGRAITVALAFDPVAPENVWSVISDELPTMPFIVMSVTSAEDGTQYNYTAMQYDPSMYAQIDNGTIIEQRPPVPSNNPYIIDAPDAVTLSGRHRVAQGITVTTLEITWSQVKDAVAYDVEWRKDDGDWIKIPRTGNISAEIDGVYSGNYLARVRAVSAFDAISKPTTSMLTEIKGKIGLPLTVVGLTATGILFGMDLKWGFAQGSGDAAFTEIQVGSAPDVNVATLTQVSYPTNTHTVTGLQGNLKQSYRARLVDKLGFKSPWSAWVTGTTDASADKVMDLIQGQINESSLNASLTTKIDKIAVNEAAISKETTDRIAGLLAANNAIGAANTAISSETQARIADILAANGRINTERDARIADVLDANNSITAEQQARIAGLLAANEGIATETTQRKEADIAINSRVDTVVSKTDTNTAGIASEITARTSADSALGVRIDTVVAKSSDNTAAINSEITARTDADSALSTRIDTVTAESGSNKTAIQTEITARTTADTALGKRIDTVTTTSGENKAAIASEVTARTNADSALSTRINTVVSKSDNNEAAIRSEVTARTDGDSALSGRIDTVSSKTDTNTATITTVNNTLTNQLGSQAEQINVMRADYKPQYADASQYADAARSVQWTYWKTVARDNYATNERITVLQSDVASSNATITQSLNTLATKDEALASEITSLKVSTGDNAAAIVAERKARTDTDTAFAVDVSALQVTTGNNATAIVTERNARTTAISAVASDITALQATTGNNTAGIASEVIARTDADTALSGRIDTLVSSVGDNNAAIVVEQKARADADGALASDITSLQAVTSSNTANISSLDTVVTDGLSALSTSIDTVQSLTATAQTTADQAISDAQSKSAAAEAAAKIYAEAQAKAKADAAQAAASTDATDKAAAAESAAKAAAALDAKNKADAALAAAKLDATAKADAATAVANAAQTAANNAATAAGNKGEVIFGSTTPVAAKRLAQNLWIDTTGGKNTPKRWDGNAWSIVTDKAATDAQSAANTAQATATEALGKANTATTNIATIQTELTATTSKTNATASSVGTLQTTVGENTASIQTAQSSIDGINLQYTVKLDSGGKVSGFGLINDGATSAFDIRADRFSISAPIGKPNDVNGTSPLMVLTTPQNIDGVSVPAGVYMRHTYIAKESVGLSQIDTASITSLSALSATIGHFKSAETGARLEIKDSLLSVYDSAGTLRVRLGIW